MFQLLNWIEALEAITQLEDLVQQEVLALIQNKILPGKLSGEADPLLGRSVRFEVRPGLLLLFDVDRVASTVDMLSIEFLISKTSLA